MTFSFEFVAPSAGAEISPEADEYEEGGGYEYFVMYACGLLAGTDCAFRIGGFGQDDWGFDVGYDMSSFVEELPALIDGVRERQDVEIYLYPQGVERTLYFSMKDSVVSVRCESETDWQPHPAVEETDRAEFIAMLRRFAQAFAESLVATAPQIAHEAPFEQWRTDAQSVIPAD